MVRVTRQLSGDYTQALAQHFRQQQWQAIDELTRLVALMPRQAHVLELYYRGAALLQLGQLDEARHCLQLAQGHSPQDGRIAYFLGRTLLAQGDAPASLPHLQRAHGQISLQESSTAAYWYVRALLEAGDGEQAASVLAAALASRPNDRHLLGLRPLCPAAEQRPGSASRAPHLAHPHGQQPSRIQADAAITANRCESLLLIDGQTVLCCGQTACSVLGQPLRLLMPLPVAPQAQPQAASKAPASGTRLVPLQLQGVVERPLAAAQGGYRFWARFRLPTAAALAPEQPLAAAAFVLQIAQERLHPAHGLDFRDQAWPQAAEACLVALQLQGVPLREARRWLDAVIGPAMVALHRQALAAQRRLPEAPQQPQRFQFGPSPAEGSPTEVSILIPLYRRWDFVRAQLSAFALDPAINSARVQVLYICDDPAIEADLLGWCHSQGHHSGLPFQVLVQPSNQGFAASINQAARLAQGDFLCLYNSDVLPCAPGWLELLLEAWRAHPEVAITTGLLLYPDGSLQHAGMEAISRPEFPGLRLNHHPGKGLAWRGGDQPQPIALCSGALMLLERQEFLELGGFRTDFIRGDFEDSDLCQRLQQRGRRCLLVPAARLWHGERQSMPGRSGSTDLLSQWRVLTNAWLAAPRPPVAQP